MKDLVKKLTGNKFVLIGVIAAALVLVVAVILILTSNPLRGNTYYYDVGKYNRYQLTFEGKTFTLKHQIYKYSSMSPSGKLIDKSRSNEETYEYDLNGKDEIVVDGETYKFTIGEKVKLTSMTTSDKYKALTFDSRFMDVAKEWLMLDE